MHGATEDAALKGYAGPAAGFPAYRQAVLLHFDAKRLQTQARSSLNPSRRARLRPATTSALRRGFNAGNLAATSACSAVGLTAPPRQSPVAAVMLEQRTPSVPGPKPVVARSRLVLASTANTVSASIEKCSQDANNFPRLPEAQHLLETAQRELANQRFRLASDAAHQCIRIARGCSSEVPASLTSSLTASATDVLRLVEGAMAKEERQTTAFLQRLALPSFH
eukprot:GHVT01065704.1.p1 GENE.GHVT01065704.1~~GHVT01065704.1.p1  ORF type:complete len:223 (-),score=31.70 GHVT01065704.1:3753-4421(-)